MTLLAAAHKVANGTFRPLAALQHHGIPAWALGDQMPQIGHRVTGGYRPSADPLTLGRLHSGLVLLDGYHRAASFWKFAPPNAFISVYVPSIMAMSD